METRHFDWIQEYLGGPQEKFARFSAAVYEDGALERTTKELIAVAASSVARCPHCTEAHIEAAKDAGADEEEIAEALSVAWTQGGGTQVFWMKDDLDELLGASWRREFIPEADEAFWAFKREVFENGVLDGKTKELIAVAVSCMLRCRHCTRGHIESAIDAGADRAEVAEALSVIWVIGGGTQVAWHKDGIARHLHDGRE